MNINTLIIKNEVFNRTYFNNRKAIRIINNIINFSNTIKSKISNRSDDINKNLKLNNKFDIYTYLAIGSVLDKDVLRTPTRLSFYFIRIKIFLISFKILLV